MNRKHRVISLALLFLIMFFYLWSNPLRRSEKYLSDYILNITPLGSTFDEVLSDVNSHEWDLVFSNTSSGFFHQGVEPNKIIGNKSIRVSLGDYQNMPFTTNVTVFWGFDNKGKLIDVWVWKTQDGI